METTEKLYETKEIAAMFKVTPQTVYIWRKTGKLPFFRIGRKTYVKAADLNELMNTQAA